MILKIYKLGDGSSVGRVFTQMKAEIKLIDKTFIRKLSLCDKIFGYFVGKEPVKFAVNVNSFGRNFIRSSGATFYIFAQKEGIRASVFPRECSNHMGWP